MATPAHCYVPLSPTTFLERTGLAFPTREAVQYPGGSVNFRELLSRSRKLAQALRDLGIGQGDCVGFLSENKLQSIEINYAIPATGGIVVTMNPWLPPSDIAYQLEFTKAKVLLVSDQFAKRHEAIFAQKSDLQHIIIIDKEDGTQTGVVANTAYDDAIVDAADDTRLDADIKSEHDPIVINFTSGTTGRPKGVVISHRAAYLHAMGQVLMLEMSGTSKYLWSLPMFHVNGWGHMWASVVVAAKQIISLGHEAEFVNEIKAHQATHLAGAPRLVRSLVDAVDGGRDIEGLTIITGGAAPSPVLITELEDIGVKLVHQYGLNETLGPYVVCEEQIEWQSMSQADRTQQRMRQGVPTIHAGTGLRVVDSDDKDVPSDGTAMGEIIMQGNTVATEYWDNKEAGEKSFVNGWFRSGDMAVVHENGYIEIKDRIKDLIYVETEYGWENISSIEVENTISHNEAIKDIAVIGVSIGEGEKARPLLIAFVEAQPGSDVDEAALKAYCEAELAAYKRPDHFFFADIPKTATGKVKKNLLVEDATARITAMG
ncbi:MAG: fatty-acyl-CoA synthase [Alteromonadaceae bacterium]|jgi:fatty-acyl-CoA synthase